MGACWSEGWPLRLESGLRPPSTAPHAHEWQVFGGGGAVALQVVMVGAARFSKYLRGAWPSAPGGSPSALGPGGCPFGRLSRAFVSGGCPSASAGGPVAWALGVRLGGAVGRRFPGCCLACPRPARWAVGPGALVPARCGSPSAFGPGGFPFGRLSRAFGSGGCPSGSAGGPAAWALGVRLGGAVGRRFPGWCLACPRPARWVVGPGALVPSSALVVFGCPSPPAPPAFNWSAHIVSTVAEEAASSCAWHGLCWRKIL